MQPIATFGGKRLGHEGGGHAVIACRAFDQLFEQYHVIGNMQRGAVGHRDLELPNTSLAGNGQIAKPHHLCAICDIVKKHVESIKLAH